VFVISSLFVRNADIKSPARESNFPIRCSILNKWEFDLVNICMDDYEKVTIVELVRPSGYSNYLSKNCVCSYTYSFSFLILSINGAYGVKSLFTISLFESLFEASVFKFNWSLS